MSSLIVKKPAKQSLHPKAVANRFTSPPVTSEGVRTETQGGDAAGYPPGGGNVDGMHEEDFGMQMADTPPTPPSVTSEEGRAICATASVDQFFQAAKLRLLCPGRWKRLFMAAGHRQELRLHRAQEAMVVAVALDDLDHLRHLRDTIPYQLFYWWGFELDLYLRAVRRCRPEMLGILPEIRGANYPSQASVAEIRATVDFSPIVGSPHEVTRRQHGDMIIEVVRAAMESKKKIDLLALKDAINDPMGVQGKNVPGYPVPSWGVTWTQPVAGINHGVITGVFSGWRALHFVVGCVHDVKGAQEAAELLIDARADPALKDASGGTALHLAALLGHTSIIDILLRTGVPIEEADSEGSTALMVAARTRNATIIKKIVSWTLTPAREEMLQEAEKGGSKYNMARSQELLHMISGNDVAAVKRLVLVGDGAGTDLADINFADAQGRHPAHIAVSAIAEEEQATAMLRVLASMKAQVNCQDFTGKTPLHVAARLGRHEVGKCLMSLKAHPALVDKNRHTPLMVAAASSMDDCRSPPPYNGRLCNSAFNWKTLEGVLKWKGLGPPPDGLPVRPPGPPEPGKVEFEMPDFGKKKKKVDDEDEEPDEEDEGADPDEQQEVGGEPVAKKEEESRKASEELEAVKARADLIANIGFDDQYIIDDDGFVNRGDRLQFFKQLFQPAGNRVHGIDALMVQPKDKDRLKPVEKRARIVWECLAQPLLQLSMQRRLNKRQQHLLEYVLYCFLGKRGQIYGILKVATPIKPWITMPFWSEIEEALQEEDLYDRVEALRSLGFRGPKPRKACWSGAVWKVDEYPRNPDYAPWEAFQYVDREDADVLGQGQIGLHGEAFKGNRLWSLEPSDPLDHKEKAWEDGAIKKENDITWEASPGFNWPGQLDKLPVPNRYDKIQLANRLFVDEALAQRIVLEKRLKIVGEKLLCPLLVESARSLAEPNVGAWTDGDDPDEYLEAETVAMHRDLLRYVASQISAASGRSAWAANLNKTIASLRKPYIEVFEKAQEKMAEALMVPAPEELATLTEAAEELPLILPEVPGECRGTKRTQFEPKHRPLEQAELIPEAEIRWFKCKQSTQAYVQLRLCGACSHSKDFVDMATALNREQPKQFAPNFWMGAYGLLLWGRGRQLRPSLDLAIRRRLAHAKWPYEDEDDDEEEEEEEDGEDDEDYDGAENRRKKKEKPVPQFVVNGPRLVQLAEVLRLDWAQGPAGQPSSRVPNKTGEQPVPAGPTGMLRTEIVCRNKESLMAAFNALTGPPFPEKLPAPKDEWDDDFQLDETESEDEEESEYDSDEESEEGSKSPSHGSQLDNEEDDAAEEEEDLGPLGCRAEVRAKRRAPIGRPAKIRVVKIINGFHRDKAKDIFPQAAGILLLMWCSARKSRDAAKGIGEKEEDCKHPLVDETDLVQQLVEVELLLDSSVEARWLTNFGGLDPSWLAKKREKEERARAAAMEAARRMKQKIGS
eukprot:TRINITY_DN28827_c0_g2_i1.p1 TRINITY_DN28827_c0_g2~~TRINITY_DN28827_c0_g2_i1.p1  ORF type:complete len:1463 (-),score=373.01 TRINITY_DN28827_c0_g2_i1:200-4588(-)